MYMMRSIITVLTIALATAISYGKTMIVIGSDDRLPVAGATMLSASGHIAGVADKNGVMAQPDSIMYPITIRSMGYEVTTITEPRDTVMLNTVEYALPEVSVTATERPFRRVVWSAREYSTGTTGKDTMQLYSEYMLESFFVDRKVKGYHSSDRDLTTKAVKRYARISGANRTDSIFMPRESDDITILAWGGTFCELPEEKVEETTAIRKGALTDSIVGKYATEKVFQKGSSRYTVITDILSNHKNHSWSPSLFKLFGMTIDIENYNSTFCFQQNEHGVYDTYDLLYSSVNLNVLAYGKIFKWLFRSKEPMTMNTYIELYPIEITSHSLEEYKEMRKDKTPLEFILPETLLPEIPAVTEIKHRIKTIGE